ncbi:unknown protein [Desulfotalea psychrophila LSv54]|uniref:Uncharacterized protein n=1 Tax=Desulfotalea psychrophila (strain LSv54 / DSM 12343) TaxID=177439 RepID=Q6AQD4_DESPS|nr:unknown protein [Desulfotalea psychrophila LSv54]
MGRQRTKIDARLTKPMRHQEFEIVKYFNKCICEELHFNQHKTLRRQGTDMKSFIISPPQKALSISNQWIS